MHGTYFITGIDTNVGKSYATGYLARILREKGHAVITQKLIQTGNEGYSEDIELHRRIMGIPPTPEDRSLLTAPLIFSYPASPHLAAAIDKRPVETERAAAATRELEKRYEIVLLEGAGGLMVPLTEDRLTIDYVAEQNYPVVLVTSGRLGSINHTLLSLEAIRNRGLRLHALVYNHLPDADDRIDPDTQRYLKRILEKTHPEAAWIDLPFLAL